MSDTHVHTHSVKAEEAGQRLDRFLADLDFMPSRAVAAKLIERGFVRVNGSTATKRHELKSGERIVVEIPPKEPSDLTPEHIPLDIRYEDDSLIVLSKPAGMVVHPATGHWSGTLVHALLAHSEDLGSLAGEERPGIVHRLDKDTTGLMMVAKTDQAQVALSDMIKVRAVSRRYLTLVHGFIAPETGIIDAPIARHPKDRMKMAVSNSRTAKQAVTTFRVLERYMAGPADDGYTLVECRLHTGRTHQVRVHMAYIEHPCVGDQQYGARKIKADRGLSRQFLHAYRITFTHPFTGAEIDLLDPLPQDLARVLAEVEPDSMGRTEAGDEVSALLEGACGT